MEPSIMSSRFKQFHSLAISIVPTPVGAIQIFADDIGVCAIEFTDKPKSEKPNEISGLCAQQIKQYLNGERKIFDVPLNAQGTDFQKNVWQALTEVPYGEISTYLSISKKVGNPLASRAVGMANGKNPISIIVPCHRIIGSNGKLTGYAGGLARKTFLLELEAKYS
jgi:methylated-DNA-[protein]-cysteine S-methyltransferase